jgi:protein SCO1/2
MTDSKLTALPLASSAGSLVGRAGRLLRSPRGLIGLAIVLLVVGAALNWSWLLAAGVAPLFLSAALCLLMCALGLCMGGMGRRNGGAGVSADSSEGAASLLSDEASCCSLSGGGALNGSPPSPKSEVARVSLAAAMLVAISALSAPALPHSLQDLDRDLVAKEKYFQPVDLQAPDFGLRDAEDKRARLVDFRGKVVVLNFINTNCNDSCPLHSEKIAQIQKMSNVSPMKSMVEFVTITTDPKRDAGHVLRDYGKEHGLDSANWVFLTAAPDQPEDTTRKIAEAYGLKFTLGDDGVQMHGVVTHVIDQDGRMRARFHGLEFEPLNLVLFVNALTNHLQKPHHEAAPSLRDRLRGIF